MITSSPPGSSPTRPLFGSSASRRSAARVYTRRTATTTTSTSASSADRPTGARHGRRLTRDAEDGDGSDTETEDDTDVGTPVMAGRSGSRSMLRSATLTSTSKEDLSRSTPTGRPGKKRKLEDKTKTPSADDITPTTRRTRSGTIGRTTSTPTLGSAITHSAPTATRSKPSKEVQTELDVNVSPPSSPLTSISDARPSLSPTSMTTSRQAPPRTPPSQRIQRTISDGVSPRNLAAQFSMSAAARTPGSPGGLSAGTGAGGSPRPRLARMLTKTQSLGVASSPLRGDNEDNADPLSRFGAALSPLGGAGQLTPGKLSRTHSMPSPATSTPSRTPGRMRLLDEGEDGTAVMRSGLFVQNERETERGRDRERERDESAPNTGSGGRARRVYGRSRTMLAESSNASPASRSGLGSEADDVVKESYQELRKKYEVDNSGEDIAGDVYADLLAARNGQSVSDLKSKGENRRFMDSLGYLVDPVTDTSSVASLRRSGALKLLVKSQESDWLDKLKICGQVERVWEALVQARDEVVDTICLIYLAVLLQSGSGIESFIAGEEAVGLVVLMLKQESAPLDEGYVGKVTGVITGIRSAYQKLDVGWQQSLSSTRRLASYVHSHLSSDRYYHLCSGALSSNQAFRRVLRSLKAEVGIMVDRKDMAAKGLPLLAPVNPADIEHILQCIETASHLMSEGPEYLVAMSEWDEQVGTCLADALACGVHLALHDGAVSRTAGRIVSEALQVLAVLVTASPEWAAYMGDRAMLVPLTRVLVSRSRIAEIAASTSSNDHGSNNPFDDASNKADGAGADGKAGMPTDQDVLCLVLALLTTGAVQSDAVVHAIHNTRMSPTCTSANACFETCTCPEQVTFAELLVDVYLSHVDSEDDESASAGIISSYTAMLISRLVSVAATSEDLDSKAILDLLPGDTAQARLQGLLGRLSELGGLEKWAHARRLPGDVDGHCGEEEVWQGNGNQDGEGAKGDGVVQKVMEELKRVMADMKDEEQV